MPFLILLGLVFSQPLYARMLQPHCVGYTTSKRMFYVQEVQVNGSTCKIEAKIISENSFKKLQMKFLVKSLDSGEPDRDSEVVRLLTDDKNKYLVFTSQPFSKENWKAWVEKGSANIEGLLNIKGQDYPVKANTKFEKDDSGVSVIGSIPSKYKYYGLEPPIVAGGAVAKVRETITLEFHLRSDKTEGANQLTK
jgi:hypothetical protein